jgi:hypothetical protein
MTNARMKKVTFEINIYNSETQRRYRNTLFGQGLLQSIPFQNFLQLIQIYFYTYLIVCVCVCMCDCVCVFLCVCVCDRRKSIPFQNFLQFRPICFYNYLFVCLCLRRCRCVWLCVCYCLCVCDRRKFHSTTFTTISQARNLQISGWKFWSKW